MDQPANQSPLARSEETGTGHKVARAPAIQTEGSTGHRAPNPMVVQRQFWSA